MEPSGWDKVRDLADRVGHGLFDLGEDLLAHLRADHQTRLRTSFHHAASISLDAITRKIEPLLNSEKPADIRLRGILQDLRSEIEMEFKKYWE